jgi:hypothetical protein
MSTGTAEGSEGGVQVTEYISIPWYLTQIRPMDLLEAGQCAQERAPFRPSDSFRIVPGTH